MSESTLFSGDFVEALIEAVEKVKKPAAQKVVLAVASGITNERHLKRVCHRHSWGKTCQYLVDNGVVKRENLLVTLNLNGDFWRTMSNFRQNHVENSTFSSRNVNVNVNNMDENSGMSLKKLMSELIPDIASLGRFNREDSFSLTTQADADVLPEDAEVLTAAWNRWGGTYWSGVEFEHAFPFALPPDFENLKIKYSEQIIGYLVHLTNEQWKIYKHNFKLVRKIFYEKDISDDLIDRIVLMQFAIGIDPFADGARQIRKWKKGCVRYKKRHDKQGYIYLASVLQKNYERNGVKWGKIRRRKDYEPLQAEAQIIRKDFYVDRLKATQTLWEHQASKKYRQSSKTTTDLVILERELREARDMFDGMPPDFKKPYKRHGRGRKPKQQITLFTD